MLIANKIGSRIDRHTRKVVYFITSVIKHANSLESLLAYYVEPECWLSHLLLI